MTAFVSAAFMPEIRYHTLTNVLANIDQHILIIIKHQVASNLAEWHAQRKVWTERGRERERERQESMIQIYHCAHCACWKIFSNWNWLFRSRRADPSLQAVCEGRRLCRHFHFLQRLHSAQRLCPGGCVQVHRCRRPQSGRLLWGVSKGIGAPWPFGGFRISHMLLNRHV